jgi:transposase
MEDIDEVYHKRIEASKQDLWEACNGLVEAHHVFLLRTIQEDTRHLEGLIAKLDQKIRQALEPYDNAVELLKGIPGLSDKSAEDLIAEIGLDMDVFPDEKHLCSWVGVSPGNNESAGKKKAVEPRTAINRPSQP